MPAAQHLADELQLVREPVRGALMNASALLHSKVYRQESRFPEPARSVAERNV